MSDSDNNSDNNADSANLKMYASSSSSILLILTPLIFTVSLTSTNTKGGIIKFTIGALLLLVLPWIYTAYIAPYIFPCRGRGSDCTFDVPANSSYSFSVTTVIIIIAMLRSYPEYSME